MTHKVDVKEFNHFELWYLEKKQRLFIGLFYPFWSSENLLWKQGLQILRKRDCVESKS